MTLHDRDVERHLERIRRWKRNPHGNPPFPPPSDAPDSEAFWIANRIVESEERLLRYSRRRRGAALSYFMLGFTLGLLFFRLIARM